jgi:hypothetical protein
VIATEDSKAAVAYFEAMASPAYYQSSRVHVEVLVRDSMASSPAHVLRQLDTWRDEFQIAEDDELWLVIDVDRWGDAKLSRIAQECSQKEIRLAVSNPAIELWFLLHLTDVAAYDETAQGDLLKNVKVSATRTRLEQEIIALIGSYRKSRLHVAHFLPHVGAAIARAENLDVRPDDRWPQGLGTRVYLLARSIIASSSLVLK